MNIKKRKHVQTFKAAIIIHFLNYIFKLSDASLT